MLCGGVPVVVVLLPGTCAIMPAELHSVRVAEVLPPQQQTARAAVRRTTYKREHSQCNAMTKQLAVIREGGP